MKPPPPPQKKKLPPRLPVLAWYLLSNFTDKITSLITAMALSP